MIVLNSMRFCYLLLRNILLTLGSSRRLRVELGGQVRASYNRPF